MNNFLINIFFIAVALSMDAFSLSLSLGIFGISKNRSLIFSIIVGSFHFIMPLIGGQLGFLILSNVKINYNFLVGIILLLLALKMIYDLFKKIPLTFNTSLISLIILGVSVSLDSFSTGMGLYGLTNKKIASSIIFSITSFFFTYLGTSLGRNIGNIFNKYATYLGIFILVIMSILFFCK